MPCPIATLVVLPILMALLCFPPPARGAAPAKTLMFAGYEWQVRAGSGGPGPNTWDANNVWVDADGALHLKIARVGGVWTCAELQTTQRLGFGSYQFQVIGAIDRLDPNVVLGLFNYPPADVGPDRTNEIDIEFARWGSPASPIGNYTVWPARAGLARYSHRFAFTLAGTYTTHRFRWARNVIVFQSLHGHTNANENQFAAWEYRPAAAQAIPQSPLPLHINLWLFKGNPPTDNNEVEIVISGFRFTPAGQVFVPMARG